MKKAIFFFFFNKVMLLMLINQMYFCDKYAFGKSVLPGISGCINVCLNTNNWLTSRLGPDST